MLSEKADAIDIGYRFHPPFLCFSKKTNYLSFAYDHFDNLDRFTTVDCKLYCPRIGRSNALKSPNQPSAAFPRVNDAFSNSERCRFGGKPRHRRTHGRSPKTLPMPGLFPVEQPADNAAPRIAPVPGSPDTGSRMNP